MTKEITKAHILQEIQDKFALRELTPEKFAFSEMVIPVYNIEPHLTRVEVKSNTLSITSSAAFMFFQVPKEEKWFLHRYNVIFVTGTYKVAGLMVTRPLPGDYCYIDLIKNQTVSYAVDLPKSIELNYGDGLRVFVDDYTSTGNLTLIADVTVEQIR